MMALSNKKLSGRAAGLLGALVLACAVSGNASAGPIVTAGGKATTPSKYVVTIKSIQFRSIDGTFWTFFAGASSIDLGSGKVQPGGSGGAIGEGVSIPAGSYNGIRVTVARSFTMNGSATAVGPGPAATCSTGGSGDILSGGYTIQVVNRNGATDDRLLSIPPEANTAIGNVPGMAIVGTDLQMTTSLPTFTVSPTSTTAPSVGVKFDVANTVEFLNTGTACYAIVLPPTVTISDPGGSSSTLVGPL
jgi:hypothetical protein